MNTHCFICTDFESTTVFFLTLVFSHNKIAMKCILVAEFSEHFVSIVPLVVLNITRVSGQKCAVQNPGPTNLCCCFV